MEHTSEINEVAKQIKEMQLVQNSIEQLKMHYNEWYFGNVSGFRIIHVNTDTFKHFVYCNLTKENGDVIDKELSISDYSDKKHFCLSIGKRLKSQIHLFTPIQNDLLLDFINRNLIKL
ncbi:MAG: hypothetical protein ACK52I_28425 [Pseudomonadota bacterium]|jgi:hypothetical protein